MQILAGILLLGGLITFHELGHFLFAKWLGVKVLVFSVGFGPKLFGFTRGETEYRLSAIPLGGYVKMFGESLEEEPALADKNRSFMHQAIWRKSLIAFAGPLFNLILPIILFFAVLVGHEQVFAPRVGTLLPEGAGFKAGLRTDDLILAVNGKPVEYFSQVAEIVEKNPERDITLRIRRKDNSSASELDIVVRPERKLSTNPLEKDQPIGRIGIMPAIELPIVVVNPKSSWANAGLKNFDEVKSIDGQAIDSRASLFSAIDLLRPGSKILVERKSLGEAKTFSIEAPTLIKPVFSTEITLSHNLSTDFSPDLESKISVTKDSLKKEQQRLSDHYGIGPANGVIDQIKADSVIASLGIGLGDRIAFIDGESISAQTPHVILHNPFTPHTMGVIKADGSLLVAAFTLPQNITDRIGIDADLLHVLGFSTASVYKPGQIIERRVGVSEALHRAFTQTVDIAVMTGKSLLMLVKSDAPASQIGGPIMLFDMAQKAAQKGVVYYIFIMCLLSVNLGLLNLLPIPALDGGHLLLFFIEAVRGKPITARTRSIVTQVGVVLLLLLMAFAYITIWPGFSDKLWPCY